MERFSRNFFGDSDIHHTLYLTSVVFTKETNPLIKTAKFRLHVLELGFLKHVIIRLHIDLIYVTFVLFLFAPIALLFELIIEDKLLMPYILSKLFTEITNFMFNLLPVRTLVQYAKCLLRF